MIFINTQRDRQNKDSALNKLSGKKPVVAKPKKTQAPATPKVNKSQDAQVDRMIRERLAFIDRVNNERHELDDRLDARNNLKSYCYNLVETLEDERLLKEDKNAIMIACTESLEWVLSNDSASKIEYENRLQQMIAICDPLVTNLNDRPLSRAGASSRSESRAAGDTTDYF